MNGDGGNPWVQVVRYLGLASTLPAAAAIGYAAGYGLDHAFGTHFLRIVFLILGIVGGFVNLLRELSREK
jgi:F0F1-type ATP synthase assembly protein I